jgi:hypothetical protein
VAAAARLNLDLHLIGDESKDHRMGDETSASRQAPFPQRSP